MAPVRGGDGEGGEGHIAGGFEPVRGLDKCQRGDLGQVLHRRSGAAVPAGHLPYQDQMIFHKLVALYATGAGWRAGEGDEPVVAVGSTA